MPQAVLVQLPRAAAREGYKLVLAARSTDKLSAIAQELGPENVLTCELDVTDMDAQQAMVEEALETFGRLDAVFANAGCGGTPGGFSGADHERWKDMILTNVYGVGLTLSLPAGAQTQQRPCAADRLCRRAGDHPGLDVQRYQVGGDWHRL